MSGAIIPKPPPERLIVAITALAGDSTARRSLTTLLHDHPDDVRREKRQIAALDESAAWLVFHLKACKWSAAHDYDGDRWETDCGTAHAFTVGTPETNLYKFCPYCGRTIQEIA
jgi:hypothetical protein